MSETGQKLIQLVREIAAENPEYVYTKPFQFESTCFNVYGGKPSCLIGHALFRAGLIDASFEGSDYNQSGIRAVSKHIGIQLDDFELSWLIRVQQYQDTSYPWGSAVRSTDQGPVFSGSP